MRAHSVEALESRRLLAAISWDGGGDGVNFTDPLNWSGDALPTANDDVTVDVPGTPGLRLGGGTINMRSLVLREPLRVETGGTLVMATTAQSDLSIELDGGALQGGAWTFGFAGALVVGTNTNSRLQVVQSITGDVLLTVAGASLTVSGSLAVNGTIRMGGQNGRLVFSGFNTLSAGTIRFQSTLSSAFPEVAVTSGELTLGSGAVVNAVAEGRGALRGGDYVNRGTIAMHDGARLDITAETFVNESNMHAVGSQSRINLIAPDGFTNAPGATVAATNGGTFAIQGTDGGAANVNTRFWKNQGTILINDGTVYLGGTVRSDEVGNIVRTGGTVRLNGVLDNVGRSFAPPPGAAPWELASGRIVGGTVNMSLTGMGDANRLVGPMTFNGNLNLDNLIVEGGVDLNGTAVIARELIAEGSQTIAGGTWRFTNPTSFPSGTDPALHIVGNATVTLGADVVVEAGYVYLGQRFLGGGAGTLINEGLIDLRPTVHTLLDSHINPGNAFINAGTVRIADGADVDVRPAGSGFLNQGLVQVGTTDHLTRLVIASLFSNQGAIDVNANVQLYPGQPGPLGMVAEQTASGYNGGAWNGPGIRSSRAAASADTTDAVGYAVVNAATPYIQIRYTRLGDADANGGVNLADFNALAANFGLASGARWDQGDFNYDRRVNLNDFNILAANFGRSIFAAATTGVFAGDDDDQPPL